MFVFVEATSSSAVFRAARGASIPADRVSSVVELERGQARRASGRLGSLDRCLLCRRSDRRSTYAVERMAEEQCRVVEQHDGLCADMYHALNGKEGLRSAQPYLNPSDATHLAQRGHDAFAKVLISLGFSPLQR